MNRKAVFLSVLVRILLLSIALETQPIAKGVDEATSGDLSLDNGPATQWSRTYGGTGSEAAGPMVQTSDGGYALAGYTTSYGAGDADFWLVKTGSSPGVDRQVASLGQNVKITIPVKNEGTVTETFDVITYHNATAIETKTVSNLAPNTETALSFVWHVTDEPFGNYIISAYAAPVPGETDTADNNCTAGIVRIMSPSGDWNHYHNYTEIVDTLLYLNDTYPHIVDLFSIGKSSENKDIYCIRLTNESNTYPKPEVFFVGYHHAREPISAELPLYFAVEAATNYGTNATITHMINFSEVYIVAALNVDAFEVLEHNEWQRKNVHPYDEDGDLLLDEDPPDDEDGDGYIEDLWQWDGSQWVFIRWEGIDDDIDGPLNEDWIGGVDLNRNYGYQWDAECDSGSPYAWAEDYRGPAPFSEPETQAIRDFALIHDFKYAISFHSGSDVIIYPWGYTNSPTPDDQLFREIAGNLSLRVGSPYEQSSIMYTTSGVWDDWMYGNRSTLALTCEVYENSSAWQYEPGPYPDSWWEKGIFQAFNPNPSDIAQVIQKWLPIFTYITHRAITEAYDIAVTDVTPLKTVVGQGYSMNINVTVSNQGKFSEIFQVTVYAGVDSIGTQLATLSSGDSSILTFAWDTAAFGKGNYNISAEATPIPGETQTKDNIGAGGIVKVTTAGNVDGDADVDASDLSNLNLAYGSQPFMPNWNPNCDINTDNKVDILDLHILGENYGKTDL